MNQYYKQCTLCDKKCRSFHGHTKYCFKCSIKIQTRQSKKWKQANSKELKIYRHNNMHKWKDNRNANIRRETLELTDKHIRRVIVQKSSILKRGDITPELIQAKRLELQFNRLRKEVKMAEPIKKRVGRPKKVIKTPIMYANDYESVDHMAKAVRGVLKSLTDKDGYYDIKEADTIGNIFGKQVHLMKVKLEAHKLAKGNIKTERKLLGE